MKSDKIRVLGVLLLTLFLGAAGCQGESGVGPTPVKSTPTRTPVSPTATSVTPTTAVSPTPMVSPTATPVTPTTAVSPTPMVSPTYVVEVEPAFPCGPYFMPPPPRELGREFSQDFLDWTPDGTHLIFSDSKRRSRNSLIRMVDAEGSQVVIVDAAGPRRDLIFGFHADVSPVDSRIVYSSCKYWTESLAENSFLPSYYRDSGFNYEIAAIGIDGTGRERLTENESFDHYPVWSPDGTRIAYISVPGDFFPSRVGRGLYTMSAGGSKRRSLSLPGLRIGFYPPVWSPDGEWLAFIANEGEGHPHRKVLYTVRADKSESARIGETTALATWSSDSTELAFVAVDGEAAVIYAVKPDGTGLRTVWMSGPEDYSSTPISQVSWSPDGAEILFIAPDGIHVVGPEGDDLRTLASGYWESVGAAWSPDGERIAIHVPGEQLFTMSRDGSDLRILLKENALNKLLDLNLEEAESP